MNPILTKSDIEGVFAEIGFDDLTESRKKEMLPKLLDHFNRVALRTTLENLNGEQLAGFEAAMNDAKGGEEKIRSITADVPGLARKIEEAVAEEVATLREARKLLSATSHE